MQWAFIFYHYYRVYYVYNEIRVFVSAYVWMTGFGNFLYFDRKGDYSLERIVSMVIRINYFPLALSYFLNVPLELYYVVPLHTMGFFMTMATCYLGTVIEKRLGLDYWKSRIGAILISFFVHVAFYETSAVDSLLLISKELHFRFQADKYSALQGLVCGLLMGKANEYMQWAYAGEPGMMFWTKWTQRASGIIMIALWFGTYGKLSDKFEYNPVHPYIFVIPVLGWLMIRNSSRWLCESHSTVLEFLGRNTLETYVLQFHVFMTKNVQHIPIVIPGSGADGNMWLRTANMLLCGVVFVSLAVWARKNTVVTQESVVELLRNVREAWSGGKKPTGSEVDNDEEASFLETEDASKAASDVEMKEING